MADGATEGRRWAIRYQPGTDLARRFPEPTTTTWPTREAAEAIRAGCPNAERMEVVEAEDDNA